MNKYDIDTPALILDIELMENNLKKMADYFKGLSAKGLKARLRPHIKTHKSPLLAQKQIAAGAVGITCAKLSEAEVMAEAGVDNILIANQIAGQQKIERLMRLAEKYDIVTIVDNEQNIDALASAARLRGIELKLLVEVDVGLHRCGVNSGKEALTLTRSIEKTKGVKFMGLQGFEGHLLNIKNREERIRRTRHDMHLLVETRTTIEKDGIEVQIVSGGGTGTYNISAEIPGIDEVQAGTYLLMDTNYRKVFSDFDCALTLLVTVISRPHPQRIVTDGGLKALSNDEGAVPEPKDIPDVRSLELHEENGIIELGQPSDKPETGDKIEIIVGHCCTTVNLHERFYAVRDEQVEDIWDIAARGKFN
ncbi:DSD1 family PLP-dependent enzyme [bacterium]|nr:DSD1 family PLP-dependent enzyme [bacterium]